MERAQERALSAFNKSSGKEAALSALGESSEIRLPCHLLVRAQDRRLPCRPLGCPCMLHPSNFFSRGSSFWKAWKSHFGIPPGISNGYILNGDQILSPPVCWPSEPVHHATHPCSLQAWSPPGSHKRTGTGEGTHQGVINAIRGNRNIHPCWRKHGDL